MCGIIGIVNKSDCVQGILAGLSKLEYRGYDSSGVATINNGSIDYRKTKGKLINLKELINKMQLIANFTGQPLYKKADSTAGTIRVSDINKAVNLLKFNPQINLTVGLQKTYKWMKNE